MQTMWPRQMGQDQAPAAEGPKTMPLERRNRILRVILDARLGIEEITDFMNAQPAGVIWPAGERGKRYDEIMAGIPEEMVDAVNSIDTALQGAGPWVELTDQQVNLLNQWIEGLAAMYQFYREDRPIPRETIYPAVLVAGAALAAVLL